ncbi:DNA polymerase I [Patescibacteria group bacterium]|nr:DNA polymerase I [Patescibacteria group bacterium]
MSTKKSKFIIIDGNALIHRAFHALPPLTNKKGELTNAVYGFTTILLKVLKDLKPTHLAVTFDLATPTFRHKEYKEYKATRIKQPDELYEQIPKVKEVVRAFNIPIYEKEGFEADDVIATVVKDKTLKGIHKTIVTGDLDALQLVNTETDVFTLHKGMSDTITYDTQAVKEKYKGLLPNQMVDYKAIVGDKSDNIIGVKGLGEVTAINLLNEFKTLENIYKNIDSKKIKDKARTLFKEQEKDAMESKRLVTLVEDVPIGFDLEKTIVSGYDQEKVIELFQELGFKSLMARLSSVFGTKAPAQGQLDLHETHRPSSRAQVEGRRPAEAGDFKYTLIDTADKFKIFLAQLSEQTAFAVDTETNELDPFFGELLGISFCWKDEEAFFVIPKAYEKQKDDLAKIFADENIKKYGHNIKYDLEVLNSAGFDLKGINFDTMIASYLISPGSRGHSLDNVVFTEFGHQMISFNDLLGKKVPKKTKGKLGIDEVPLSKLSDYSCEDADFTFRLVAPLKKQLKKNQLIALLEKIELPLIPVLAKIEKNGVMIDSKFLNKLSTETGNDITKLQKQIYKLAGSEFNIASPLQLKKVLFEDLKISTDGLSKTKTGVSTAAAELEKMKGKHPIIDLISQIRELSKLKSTYLDALPKLVSKFDKRVHTSYNQTITATGRLSSSDPNLQNIPIRTDIGQRIRKAFIAPKGYKIIAADYSQIELRVIASIANDTKMLESFKKGEDIHTRTAAEIYDVSLDKVDKKMRRHAKTINFGIIYGMGAYGLARGADISIDEAQNFIDTYFTLHNKIWNYMEDTKKQARKIGYVETLFGRKRYLPEIESGMQQVRAGAERAAINHPIQGTAADLMKLAMIKISNQLSAISNQSKMIMQVHDELVFEVPEKDVEKVAKFIETTMNNIYKLRTSIQTDVEVGDNWGELKNI